MAAGGGGESFWHAAVKEKKEHYGEDVATQKLIAELSICALEHTEREANDAAIAQALLDADIRKILDAKRTQEAEDEALAMILDEEERATSDVRAATL